MWYSQECVWSYHRNVRASMECIRVDIGLSQGEARWQHLWRERVRRREADWERRHERRLQRGRDPRGCLGRGEALQGIS